MQTLLSVLKSKFTPNFETAPVLIVGNDPWQLQYTRAILKHKIQKIGYELVSAENSAEAINCNLFQQQSIYEIRLDKISNIQPAPKLHIYHCLVNDIKFSPKINKIISKYTTILCKKSTEIELKDWIKYFCQKYKISLSPEIEQDLTLYYANNLPGLSQYFYQKKLHNNFDYDIDHSKYDGYQAINHLYKNPQQTIRIISATIKHNPLIKIIWYLTKELTDAIIVLENNLTSVADVQKKLELFPSKAKVLLNHCKGRTLDELYKLSTEVHELDRTVKSKIQNASKIKLLLEHKLSQLALKYFYKETN